MSLDVLLQAAQFVDHNQKSHNSNEPSSVQSCGTADTVSAAPFSREYESRIQEPTLPFPTTTRSDGGMSSNPTDSDSLSEASPRQTCRIKRQKRPAPQSQENEKTKRGTTKQNTENRSVHNVLEKNRRAHLKDCFESLKMEVMESDDDKKASHLAVLKSAVRCIQQVQKQTEQLQRDTDRALKEKNAADQRLLELKMEIVSHNPSSEVMMTFMGLAEDEEENDSQATCTAPGSPDMHTDNLRNDRFTREPASLTELSSSNLTSTPSMYASSSSTSGTEPKRKRSSRYSESKSASSRRPPIKSVTEILQETRPDLPVSPEPISPPVSPKCRSPVNSMTKKSLPIRLRILQDQHDGLFTDPHYKSDISSTSPVLSVAEVSSSSSECQDTQTAESTHSQIPGGFSWQTNFTAFPFYGRSGYSLPMFPVNQLFLPVSTSANSPTGSGQIVMVPAAAASALVSDIYHRTYQQRPSSPS